MYLLEFSARKSGAVPVKKKLKNNKTLQYMIQYPIILRVDQHEARER